MPIALMSPTASLHQRVHFYPNYATKFATTVTGNAIERAVPS
jgi:hypothetical protein